MKYVTIAKHKLAINVSDHKLVTSARIACMHRSMPTLNPSLPLSDTNFTPSPLKSVGGGREGMREYKGRRTTQQTINFLPFDLDLVMMKPLRNVMPNNIIACMHPPTPTRHIPPNMWGGMGEYYHQTTYQQ